MSQPAPKLRRTASSKHSSQDDPSLVRSLVTSTPLHEAPATAVIEEHVDASAPATAGAHSSSSSVAWNTHLATLLHSMYLVTFTEKAQLGAMYSRNGGATAQQANHSSTAAASIPTPDTPRVGSGSSAAPSVADALDVAAGAAALPVSSHSITVDARWLDAVTRYCHFTVTLDDVARVAMVFPELLQVRWSVEQQDRRAADAAPLDALSGAHTLGRTADEERLQLGGDGVTTPTRGSAGAVSVSAGKLVARVYLCQDRVISMEEADRQLTQSLRTKSSPTAQRAWRALVNHHTASAAFVDSLNRRRRGGHHDGCVDVSTAASDANADAPMLLQKEASLLEESSRLPKNSGVAVEDTVSDEVLCASLSAELRASLSAAKLHALLRQMRRDAAHVEEAEQHRIAQRQLQERMLNAYEHVRALYGPKDTRGRSALSLLTAMQHESRFEDTLDIKALLSTLLAIPASGLSATMLREERVVAEPVPPAGNTKGVATRGKRKRAEEGSAETPVVVRVAETALVPVTDLRELTDAELELVLVRLDRAHGSVKGVLDATTHKAQ